MSITERQALWISLGGIRDLYRIILGISMTASLVSIPTLECSWTFLSYLTLLLGFLSTVLRFALETNILMEVLHRETDGHLERSTFFVTVLCLLSAVAFFLMGHNIDNFQPFMLYVVVLLGLDTLMLLISHKPWQKGDPLFWILKSLSIFSGYWLFPRFNPEKDASLSPEKQLVKRTHYQWTRSNVLLIMLILLFNTYWASHTLEGVCPVDIPHSWGDWEMWLQFTPQKEWFSQVFLGTLLLAFSVWDFTTNYAYYFGMPRSDEPANLSPLAP